MKVAIASDHRGFAMKHVVIDVVRRMGHEVQDFGCDGTTSVDYPDYAAPAARAVANGQCDAAILLDGSGIGMTIVANKVSGVRAAVAHDEMMARRAREHNHCNALCLGADLLSEAQIRTIVQIFLSTEYQPGRHERRIAKIRQIEAQQC
ncbi:ribose 5-phosphate isomerase B [Fontivita pretiosa]|uniref:ribose 5-phosphate isomerase B n=1 Tax=Fontivita pretiosa TaxID=2989684 RepID=UPI003D163A86